MKLRSLALFGVIVISTGCMSADKSANRKLPPLPPPKALTKPEQPAMKAEGAKRDCADGSCGQAVRPAPVSTAQKNPFGVMPVQGNPAVMPPAPVAIPASYPRGPEPAPAANNPANPSVSPPTPFTTAPSSTTPIPMPVPPPPPVKTTGGNPIEVPSLPGSAQSRVPSEIVVPTLPQG